MPCGTGSTAYGDPARRGKQIYSAVCVEVRAAHAAPELSRPALTGVRSEDALLGAERPGCILFRGL